jgi:hypothetical protein
LKNASGRFGSRGAGFQDFVVHFFSDAADLDEDQSHHGAKQAAKHHQNWIHYGGLPSRIVLTITSA